MTRLRQPERQILDTLVDSGVARSRSDAVVWAVRLLGQNADAWLGDLRNGHGRGQPAPRSGSGPRLMPVGALLFRVS